MNTNLITDIRILKDFMTSRDIIKNRLTAGVAQGRGNRARRRAAHIVAIQLASGEVSADFARLVHES